MRYENHFFDLHAATDDVHAHFQRQIEAAHDGAGPVDALCRLRLAVHEWMTNLMRHARFDAERPEVHVCILRQGALLCCTIEDNSRGFDLAARLDERPGLAAHARTLPENGGLGLLLLEASTEDLNYTGPRPDAADRWNRLRLTVRPGAPVTQDEP